MKLNRIRRNKDIQADYKALWQAGFRRARILEDLAKKYYLSEEYVGDIVCMDLPEISESVEEDQLKDNTK